MRLNRNARSIIACLFLSVFIQAKTDDDTESVCENNAICQNPLDCESFTEAISSASSLLFIRTLVRTLHCGFNGTSSQICCLSSDEFKTRFAQAENNTKTPADAIYFPTTTKANHSIEPAPSPMTTTTTATNNNIEDTTKTTSKHVDTTISSKTAETTITTTATPLKPPITNCVPIDVKKNESEIASIDSRIKGGKITTKYEFPWVARIATRDRETNKNRYTCTGTLISDRYVLTAAHCAYKINEPIVGVRLGEYDIEISSCKGPECDNSSIMDIGVKNAIIHDNFKGQSVDGYDIALLELTRTVNFTETVKPICLPISAEGYDADYDPNNERKYNYTAAGWGITEFNNYSVIKRKVSLPSVHVSDCINKFAYNESLSDSIICAGGEKGKDVCYGDSGTSLARSINDHWYIFGIASSGPLRCGTEGVPGIYTRVTRYLDWIKEHMT